jgi:Ser/Thr protein kinase RdoA (MazF antagonist)
MHDTVTKINYDFMRPIFIHNDGPINPIPSLLEKVDPAIAEVYESMKKELATFSKSPETFGLIHNDLHQGNFFVMGNELILYDFDDCAYNWFAQDLAVSMYHALWTGESFHPEWTDFHDVFIANFFEGYTSIRSISADDSKLISIFLRMRELFLLLLFKSTWNLECLEEWQQAKLIELEESVRNRFVPYEDLLKEQCKPED